MRMKKKNDAVLLAERGKGVKNDPSSLDNLELRRTNEKKVKTFCQSCKKKCSGQVLRVQDKYFHIGCFKCAQCNSSLAQGGFFPRDGSYYCTKDYRERWGTRCSGCGEYVEGDVVTAGEKHSFHPNCFHCQRCRKPLLGEGTKVTLVQGQALCHRCVGIPVREATTPVCSNDHHNRGLPAGGNAATTDPGACAGCGLRLQEGQALVALDRQWHVWCFKCHSCDTVLHGEYMGKDGVPYCEKDYQKQFGVKCAYCSRYISGKVLQAGENHHFHPTCARCTKCGDPFGDGEEMYLQGAAIWHPRCGPGPTGSNGIVNGHGHAGEPHTPQHRESERVSSSASEMQFSMRSRTPSLNGSMCSPYSSLGRKYYPARTGSPGLILREYGRGGAEDVSRIYTYSYLTETPSQGYLRRPIQPYDKPPTSPHFHRPSSSRSIRSSGGRSSRSGMRALVDALSETRPKSPAAGSQVDNDEPIELAHYPDAMKPPPGTKPPIERDDFPAPPYPYTDPERRRRWSDTYKGVPESDDEDEVDHKGYIKEVERKLKKEHEELSKIDTGIAKVFLQDREKDRENLRHRAANVDPRNASRTPSAAREPTYRLRYESPVGASPSRNIDHARPWEDEDGVSYKSSTGPSYNVVSSLRHIPKPGYGLAPRSHTFSSTGGSVSALPGDYSFSGMGDKTHSTDFSSGKSDISTGSITDVDRRALVCTTTAPFYSRRISMNDGGILPSSTTYTGGLGSVVSGGHHGHHVRRSLPDMGAAPTDPPKLYPYHLLIITNYRLPADVDRCHLERHLSDAEFEAVLQCGRSEFYRLPQWRRNEIKRRARLF